jgi:Hemerythrin HHE cation binding domain
MKGANMTTSKRKPGAAADAVSLLIAEHKKAQAAFKAFEAIKDGNNKREKAKIVQQTCTDLAIHMQIEEEVFYPAVRKAIKDNDLMDEATVEHAGAKNLVAELLAMQPGDDLYDAKFTVLGEDINHHVKEEQTDMFPKARKSSLDLVTLGAQLARRREELERANMPPVARRRDVPKTQPPRQRPAQMQ